VRLTESGNARSEQLLVMPTELLIDCMASRRAPEWITMFEDPAGF